ncbi:fused MFS/spermidine synthase [Qipengyuania atrilutea]|uniref:fused MFS/spermidine synthase n=1 Tax=Qipengyuania atrilutea TaxID=2744473 RepID=UPI00298E8894|nr:fused MFS/spermidine synthase [Actirhodobacter atriluteus]
MTSAATAQTKGGAALRSRRWLFVITLLTGSFLLFLVQPLVARLALPLLGGAPNVWNSAMLVYQALLLGGYAYAYWLTRWPLRKQAIVHIALLGIAGLTLPIGLAELPSPAPGWEPLWVPALLALTIGPVFFLVSAQAPLMQQWFAADSRAGDPYWLYAASNVGSFAGLLAYPLLFEPNLSLQSQSIVWSIGYALLAAMVAGSAAARWKAKAPINAIAETAAPSEPIPAKRILLWLALAAVPSGLMLSTTTHLTTDLFAMPLLWVIPLGLYLLSYVPAFATDRSFAWAFTRPAPIILLLAGSMAMVSRGTGNLSSALAAIVLLFVVATTLHGRLYDTRPAPDQLTLFYLVMASGGVLGGIFTALIAPVVFDWVWEHPLLIIAAGALLPGQPLIRWMDRLRMHPRTHSLAAALLVVISVALGSFMVSAIEARDDTPVLLLTVGMAICGILALGKKWAFLMILVILMMARGGLETLKLTLDGDRSRSYFGVYTVRNYEETQRRALLHGTTMHGLQSFAPGMRSQPLTYYGPTSGVGLALANVGTLYGPEASVGVVGLGTGSLACYREPDQSFDFFEIDPQVLRYSRGGVFTFLEDCAPEADILLGDARLKLAELPPSQYDILVIDAFSSDAIPLHLLTEEAFETYARALKADGMLLLHISNRFIELRPVMAAAAEARGWDSAIRSDVPGGEDGASSSDWIVTGPGKAKIAALREADAAMAWDVLPEPESDAWTDDHASILPFIKWENMLGS